MACLIRPSLPMWEGNTLPWLTCAPTAGHRSLKPTSLPIKRGMLHYAHSRKLPVQVRAAGRQAVRACSSGRA